METTLLLGLEGMTSNELCCKGGVLLAELTSTNFKLRFLFHFPEKGEDPLYLPQMTCFPITSLSYPFALAEF